MRATIALIFAMLYYFAPIPGAVAADASRGKSSSVLFRVGQGTKRWHDGSSVEFGRRGIRSVRGSSTNPWRPSPARKVSGLTPDHAWGAGLSAWRLGDYETAAVYFEALAESERASPWSVSAGAFWAGRSHLFARRPDQVSHWLGIAPLIRTLFTACSPGAFSDCRCHSVGNSTKRTRRPYGR